MLPTLNAFGDWLMVNKFAVRWKRHALKDGWEARLRNNDREYSDGKVSSDDSTSSDNSPPPKKDCAPTINSSSPKDEDKSLWIDIRSAVSAISSATALFRQEFSRELDYGDLVLAKCKYQPDKLICKRIIALPGDYVLVHEVRSERFHTAANLLVPTFTFFCCLLVSDTKYFLTLPLKKKSSLFSLSGSGGLSISTHPTLPLVAPPRSID